jgi:hypothetical protein
MQFKGEAICGEQLLCRKWYDPGDEHDMLKVLEDVDEHVAFVASQCSFSF